MGNGSHVVEELGVHGPAAVLLPNRLAHQSGPGVFDRLTQGEAFFAHDHIAQALICHASLIGRLGCRREPTFIDATAVRPVGVGVIWVEFEAKTRLQEGAGHPGRSQAQQTSGA